MEKQLPRITSILKGDMLILGLVLLVIFFLRLPNAPLVTCDVDEGIYLGIAQEIVRGGIPYADMWEQKGPLLFYYFVPQVMVFGTVISYFRIFHTLYLMGQMCIVYLIGKPLLGGKQAVIPPLIYGLFFLRRDWWTHCINGEPIMIGPTLIAFYLYTIILRKKGDTKMHLLWCGIFCSAAVLVKQTALFSILAIPATMLFQAIVSKDLKKLSFDLKYLLGGAAILPLLFSLYFMANSAFYDFIDQFILYPSSYTWLSFSEKISIIASRFYLEFIRGDISVSLTHLGIVSSAFAVSCMGLSKRHSAYDFLILSSIPLSMIGVAWGGHAFAHYFIQMALPLTLVHIISLRELGIDQRKMDILVVLSVITILLAINIPDKITDYNVVMKMQSSDPIYLASMYVKHNSEPSDSIQVHGMKIQTYFFAERRPPTRDISLFFMGSRLMDRGPIIQEIIDKKPKFILQSQNGDYQNLTWEDYVPIKSFGRNKNRIDILIHKDKI